MKYKIHILLVVFLIGNIFVLSSCSKKQVKTGGGIEELDIQGKGEVTPRMGKVDIGYSASLRLVHFDYDRYNLTEEAQQALKNNVEWLQKNKNIKIQIEGHCDNRGTPEYNVALGQKRAEAVRSYFIDLGISAKRLSMVSYGEEKPLNFEETEDAWFQNRRAEFVITSK